MTVKKVLFSVLILLLVLPLASYANEPQTPGYYTPTTTESGQLVYDPYELGNTIPILYTQSGKIIVPIQLDVPWQHNLHSATVAWLSTGGKEIITGLIREWIAQWHAGQGDTANLVEYVNGRLQRWLHSPLPELDTTPAEQIRQHALSASVVYPSAEAGGMSAMEAGNPCYKFGAVCEMQYICVDPDTGVRRFCDCDDSCIDCCDFSPDAAKGGGFLHARRSF